MKIHRGVDQIGGCITEISSSTTRVVINFGLNLPIGDELRSKICTSSQSVDEITIEIEIHVPAALLRG